MSEIKSARASLLSVLVGRAEQQTARSHPYRRVSWGTIRRGLLAVRRRDRELGPRRFALGAAPLWMLDLALAADVGRERGSSRGAGLRLSRLLTVARHLRAWGGGLRFEELLALTRMGERELHGALAWAGKKGLLVDLGERGWFFGPWKGDSEDLTAEARRLGRGF